MAEPTRNALDVILAELSPLDGKKLLDIGCGRGGLCGPLRQAGALWRGLDPMPGPGGLPIDVAPAEALPYPDDSFDAAVCVNALHHVPVAAMRAALGEAARVLRPGGKLVVIEPMADGALSRVIAVVDDETEIRDAAQTAMDRTPALAQVANYTYARTERYDDFNGFCASIAAVDPGRLNRIRALRDRLRQVFADRAGRDGDGWTLSQPMSVRVFQPV